jgi:hypothetical protein
MAAAARNDDTHPNLVGRLATPVVATNEGGVPSHAYHNQQGDSVNCPSY